MGAPAPDPEVWIGLVEVRPLPGAVVLGGAAGAYTTALAWAADAAGFERDVRAALATLHLAWVTAEDVEPLILRRTDEEVTEEVLRAAEAVRAAKEARLLPFHTWTGD